MEGIDMPENSQINTRGQTIQLKTHFRWVIMGIIFVTYAINYMDRTNIGVVLPFISQEFGLSNFEAGALASTFFLGYAASQIPAGFFFSKFGTRGLVSLSILGFSLFTYLIGTASSPFMIKLYRFLLGVSEGPTPVGCVSTINNWFPAKEKGTATGLYIASTMFAPILVPPLVVWIALEHGWRSVFFWFAIPGLIMAIVWYLFVKSSPEKSEHVSPSELAYIQGADLTTAEKVQTTVKKSLGWIDSFIRAKKVAILDSNAQVFRSRNIWGICIAYFLMVSVLYGLLTWIPSYLVKEKGFSFMKMGLVAAAPWIGGFVGSITGGWLSDNVFLKRRKPTMIITTLSTAIMMVVLINIPNDANLVALALFMTGFLINVGWPAFTAYPMGLASNSTYPVAISLVNTGGNLGGFFSPMIAGLLLDKFTSFTNVFVYFGVAAALAFVILLTIDEPVNEA
jgi:sugar phosphate permease